MKIRGQLSFCILFGLFFFNLSICQSFFAWAQEPPAIDGLRQEMIPGETQELSITNYKSTNQYTWRIANGQGLLSANTGKRVLYTAPSSNPSCKNS
nr:hypothetical protein [Desulfobacterales bacterium]